MINDIFMTEVVQPVLIKAGSLFLACTGDGGIVSDCGVGLGLLYRDTRYLSRYEIRIGGETPLTLMCSAAGGSSSVHQMSNRAIKQLDGRPLDTQSIGVRLDCSIDGERLLLSNQFAFRNYTGERVTFRVSILIDALFEDIFELRGVEAKCRGSRQSIEMGTHSLQFRYAGADGHERTLGVAFSVPPAFRTDNVSPVAEFDFALDTQATDTLSILFDVYESDIATPIAAPRPPFYERARIESDNPVLDRCLERSFKDLTLLGTGLEADFIAGGAPWFIAPFGRDSILAALQTLAFDARPAEGVARLFALHQGKTNDAETREQPGKIPHELRLGAMANLNEVPHHPSYSSTDSTPLFLILVGRHVEWTGSVELFDELRPAVDAALTWMTTDGDGYLSYSGVNENGLINQGWKDSSAGVPRKDGSTPAGPIALCEIQGYAYLARILISKALRHKGEDGAAERLERDAEALRQRFNQDFWMEDEGCFALALEAGGRQVTPVTSNAGQLLWTGIADPDKADRNARRMMRPDMNSGWGIRTLSDLEAAYNPLNYHLGSVWPFDTALIMAGMVGAGLATEAIELFDGIVAASSFFSLGRLPEFYVGHAREADVSPSRCPFAEPMQAWSAGATPFMLATLLGLSRGADGLEIVDPKLPGGVDRLDVRGLTIGAETYHCAFTRQADGNVSGRIVAREASGA